MGDDRFLLGLGLAYLSGAMYVSFREGSDVQCPILEITLLSKSLVSFDKSSFLCSFLSVARVEAKKFGLNFLFPTNQ